MKILCRHVPGGHCNAGIWCGFARLVYGIKWSSTHWQEVFLIITIKLFEGNELNFFIFGYLGVSRSLFVLLLLTALDIWFCQTIPSQVGMNSIMQAKTKIGHAVVMILQVGVLEKFQSVPLVTGLDLACFAGAVFLSATCIFLLSKLSIINNTPHGL